MPLMNELIDRLKDDPPSTKQELYDLLDETGYGLILKEPRLHRDKMHMKRAEEKGGCGEERGEYEEDMGPDDDSFPQELVNLLPDGMQDPGTNPRQKTRAMTIIIAKKLGNKEEEKHG
jgi:hypothetical protein